MMTAMSLGFSIPVTMAGGQGGSSSEVYGVCPKWVGDRPESGLCNKNFHFGACYAEKDVFRPFSGMDTQCLNKTEYNAYECPKSAPHKCKFHLFTAAATLAQEVGTCGSTSPSTVSDCQNVDFGSCGNACCRLQFTVDEDPLAAMQKLNSSFADGGADGYFKLQMTHEKTLGFADIRAFKPPGGYEFIGQVHHTTSGPAHYVDEVNFNIRPQQCAEGVDCSASGSIIKAFSTSLIAGALGDNGQNYKNIVMAMKNVDWKVPFAQSDSDGSCPSAQIVV